MYTELAVKKDQPSTAKVVVNAVRPETTAPKDRSILAHQYPSPTEPTTRVVAMTDSARR
jgi:hypothetical protein